MSNTQTNVLPALQDMIFESQVKLYEPDLFGSVQANTNIPSSNGMISQRELNAVIAAIEAILPQIQDKTPTEGRIALWAKPEIGDAVQLIQITMKDGDYTKSGDNSCSQTANSIAALLKAIQDPRNSRNPYVDIGSAKMMGSGIYTGNGKLKVLYLETTFGRFIGSAYVDFEDANFGGLECSAILIGIATALANLRECDRALQYAASSVLTQNLSQFVSRMGTRVAGCVEELFRTQKHPVIQEWRPWYDANVAAGQLKPFFV